MKNNLLKVTLFLFLSLLFFKGYSQSSVEENIYADNTPLKSKYTFDRRTKQSPQPYELITTIGRENPEIQLEMPGVKDQLNLNIANLYDNEITEFKLIDAAGKVISEKKIDETRTCISFDKRMAGTYFIQVFAGGKLKKQFNIKKNQE